MLATAQRWRAACREAKCPAASHQPMKAALRSSDGSDRDVVRDDHRVVAGRRGQPEPQVHERARYTEEAAARGAWNGERVVDARRASQRQRAFFEADRADAAGDRSIRQRRARRARGEVHSGRVAVRADVAVRPEYRVVELHLHGQADRRDREAEQDSDGRGRAGKLCPGVDFVARDPEFNAEESPGDPYVSGEESVRTGGRYEPRRRFRFRRFSDRAADLERLAEWNREALYFEASSHALDVEAIYRSRSRPRTVREVREHCRCGTREQHRYTDDQQCDEVLAHGHARPPSLRKVAVSCMSPRKSPTHARRPAGARPGA